MGTREDVIAKLKRYLAGDGKKFEDFTPEENREVPQMIAIGILSKEAFRHWAAGDAQVYQPIWGRHPFLRDV
jgi:hypothetical protein